MECPILDCGNPDANLPAGSSVVDGTLTTTYYESTFSVECAPLFMQVSPFLLFLLFWKKSFFSLFPCISSCSIQVDICRLGSRKRWIFGANLLFFGITFGMEQGPHAVWPILIKYIYICTRYKKVPDIWFCVALILYQEGDTTEGGNVVKCGDNGKWDYGSFQCNGKIVFSYMLMMRL